MKKTILLLLTLSLILGVFSSCGHKTVDTINDGTSSSPSEDTSAESTTEEIYDGITETINITTNIITEERIDITLDTNIEETTAYHTGWIPGEDQPYYYNSHGELINSLNNAESEIRLDKEKWGVRFSKFIDVLSERKSVPLINEQMLSFGEKDIIIFPDDSYKLPWIWYRCYYNEQPMIIHITYPDAILGKDFSCFESTSNVLKEIWLNAPNVHNFDDNKDAYKNIYEKDLIIEGQTVSALFVEPIDAFYSCYVHFYYNGIYVYIRSYSESFTNEFWQGFSIG